MFGEGLGTRGDHIKAEAFIALSEKPEGKKVIEDKEGKEEKKKLDLKVMFENATEFAKNFIGAKKEKAEHS